jgi:hypothetical protein
MARAEGFADFFTQTPVIGDPQGMPWCYKHHRGYTFHKDTGYNQEFSAGTSIAELASLNVHASFSRETSAIWTINKGVYICGSDQAGLIASKRVAARYIPPARGRCSQRACLAVRPTRNPPSLETSRDVDTARRDGEPK